MGTVVIPGLVMWIFIIAEIVNLGKAARMTAADFPDLSPEDLETKRRHMRLSAWWLLGGIIGLCIGGTCLLYDPGSGVVAGILGVAFAIGCVGFLVSLGISAFHGGTASKLS